jgi:hypothetical protein
VHESTGSCKDRAHLTPRKWFAPRDLLSRSRQECGPRCSPPTRRITLLNVSIRPSIGAIAFALGCGAPNASVATPVDDTNPWWREFRAYAEARGACVRSEECSIVRADCPLYPIAVSWGRADEVVAKRDAIAREAGDRKNCKPDGGGAAPPVASCVDGRCELALPALE